MTSKATTTILAGSALALLALDVYLAADHRRGNTISEVARTLPPIVIFGAGVVVGHWWWTPNNR